MARKKQPSTTDQLLTQQPRTYLWPATRRKLGELSAMCGVSGAQIAEWLINDEHEEVRQLGKANQKRNFDNYENTTNDDKW